MDDIKKWFLKCCNDPAVEIKDVGSLEEASDFAKISLSACNEVRVVEVVYRSITQTPYLINPNN